jgi:hypothetical protein
MEMQPLTSDFSPTIIKDVLLLSPGRWNNVDYTELEIQKAFHSTDWQDKKHRMLYLDHQDTKERGVANFGGFVTNPRLLGSSLFGDLEVWNPMVAVWLSKAKAKFGISATLAGRENRQLARMEDFHFESFSVVTDPACKPAMINLSAEQGDVHTVVTLNETKEELESVKHEKRREDIESVGDKKDFESALKAMKADEKKAPGDYENLKSLAPHEECKKKIDGIIADEKRHYQILEGIESKNELSAEEVETLANEEVTKLKTETLDAIFERQVSHIMDSLKHSHPDWSEAKRKQVAYATANKMKNEDEKKNADRVDKSTQSLSETHAWNAKAEDVKHLACNNITQEGVANTNTMLKGGLKMPDKIENDSKVVELASVKVVDAVPKIEEPAVHDMNVNGHSIFIKQEGKKLSDEAKEEPKSDKSDKEAEKKKADKEDKKDKDEDKEEMSSEAILNKVKEMSAEELVSYTNFVREYLSAHVGASAKEVTLAFIKKSKDDKDKKKEELSASELLSSIDQRIASLKELDSNKKMQELETKVKELSAKVKTPDRKTLSVAFESSNKDSNLGMLSFLQNRMN